MKPITTSVIKRTGGQVQSKSNVISRREEAKRLRTRQSSELKHNVRATTFAIICRVRTLRCYSSLAPSVPQDDVMEVRMRAQSVGLLLLMISLFLLSTPTFPQSGNWDATGTTGAGAGLVDHGNGVIQLLDTNAVGCQGAAVHERTSTYNPVTDAAFVGCYQVYFGCPGDDQIGGDTKGDGLAFSFSDCIWTVGTCGGGLGYRNACGKMITVEFDTWSSESTAGFDSNYEGTGNQDQVALHKDGDPEDFGKIVGANPGNLEDGLEHEVCIRYDPTTDIFIVEVDQDTILEHDLTGSGYELETYFGSVGLYQSWSSGKDGATNPATVSHGQDITDQVGAPLCGQGVFVTSPTTSAVVGSCGGPFTINSFVVPPAGNTVDSVEFYVDGNKVGVDASENYALTWNDGLIGNREVTTKAFYSPSMTSAFSDTATLTIGGHIEQAGSPPTIDGVEEGFWSGFVAIPLDQGSVASPDLDATYKVCYDASNLYALVHVTDDDLQNDNAGSANDWQDDGVDIYIDVNNDKAGAYAANDFQYSLPYGSPVYEYKHAPGSLTGVSYASAAVAGGYVVEVSIPLSTLGLGSPAPGDEIGFDVLVNDDDGGGTRDDQLSWKDGTFGAWSNTSLFGTQQFDDCIVLSADYLDVKAKAVEEGVLLSWSSLEDVVALEYLVEFSSDLTDWSTLEVVGASDKARGFVDMQFLDYSFDRSSGYYRVTKIGIDGEEAVSSVVYVASESLEIEVFPNPIVDELNIAIDSDEEIKVSICDMLGKPLLIERILPQQGYIHMPVDLVAGAYVVCVEDRSGVIERVGVWVE